MKRVLAIAGLAFQEGLRMRIVLVVLIVLVFAVLRLPFALKGDDTLSGRLQNFLAYSLSALSIFMGLATVFLSCATLTKEIQSRSLHMVVVKPVSRFEILIGKWLGVNLLNLLMVLLAGLVIYAFAVFIRNRPETFQRDRVNLRDVIWTARIAATPTTPDFRKAAEEYVDQQLKADPHFTADRDAAVAEVIKQQRELWRAVPPNDHREYLFENLAPPESEDTVFQIRFKARGVPLPPNEVLRIGWAIVSPDTGELLSAMESLERSGETHQFLIRAAKVVSNGRTVLGVVNPPTEGPRYAILFEGDDSLQMLYKVSSFEMNYVKTLALILCRLAFLSAVGLFFGTFVSFPVACFCTLSIYLFCIGIPWWLESIGANLPNDPASAKVDPYGAWGPYLRMLLVPLLHLAFPDFIKYDGVGALIDGTYIDYGLLLRGAAHTLVYGALLLVIPGWLIFQRREIAEVVV